MSAGSGEIVTYHLRVAKQIERKMICDTLIRLGRFEMLPDYRYIGFGSFYFPEFILFHRRLGMREMHNIEGKATEHERFEHNRPFGCVALHYGMSSVILPGLLQDHLKKTILWLDYDEHLDNSKLQDVDVACRKLISGSFLMVTAKVEPDPEKERMAALAARFPPDLLPPSTELRNLGQWGTAHYYRELIAGQIEATLANANQTSGSSDPMRYEQVLYFHYQDSVRMMTVGGLMYRASDESKLQECKFGDLTFVRRSGNAFPILIPRISYREQQYLDSLMPCSDFGSVDTKGIPIKECTQYCNIYRYFPTYSDVEI